MVVEFAKVSETEKMLQILTEGFPASLLSYIPLGCPGAREYVVDLIGLQNHGCDSRWIVVRDERVVAGFVEMRLYSDELFVNYIYIRSNKQNQGLGTHLLKQSLEMTRREGINRVGLHVYVDNEGARRWYSRIGFFPVEEQIWAIAQIEMATTPGWYCVAGIPQANVVHARYGFSQFVLRTSQGNYEIGRLGTDVYRATNPRILENSAALWGLRQLDPSRHLLLICRADMIDVDLHPQLVPINKAVRFVHDDLDKLMAYMGS